MPNRMKPVTEKMKKNEYSSVVGFKLKDFPGKGDIKCSIRPNEVLVHSAAPFWADPDLAQ